MWDYMWSLMRGSSFHRVQFTIWCLISLKYSVIFRKPSSLSVSLSWRGWGQQRYANGITWHKHSRVRLDTVEPDEYKLTITLFRHNNPGELSTLTLEARGWWSMMLLMLLTLSNLSVYCLAVHWRLALRCWTADIIKAVSPVSEQTWQMIGHY